MTSALPSRLRPQGRYADSWSFIGQVVDTDFSIADGWQRGDVCVMSSVDVAGDGHEYHLSVRIQDSRKPPAKTTLLFVEHMFGMPGEARYEQYDKPEIVHIYAPTTKGTP